MSRAQAHPLVTGKRSIVLDPDAMRMDQPYSYALDGVEYTAVRRADHIEFYEHREAPDALRDAPTVAPRSAAVLGAMEASARQSGEMARRAAGMARPRRRSYLRLLGTLLRLLSGAGIVWFGILALGAARDGNDFVYAALGVVLMLLGCYLVIGDGRE